MFRLVSGAKFDPYRPRSQGVLNREELAFCRRYHIPVAYDPAQIGWVAMTEQDDFAPVSEVGGVLSDLKRALASDVAQQLKHVEAVNISLEKARQQLFEKAAALAARYPCDSGNLQLADKIYSELHREAIRFLPLGSGGKDTGRRFCYRRWAMSDVSRYIHILGNPKVWEYLPDAPATQLTQEMAEAMITVANEDPHHDVFAVEKNREVIGQVRLLYNQEYPNMRGAEIAYLLSEEYWGQGLMGQILLEFTDKALREHNFDLLCAWIHPDNIGSVKCAEEVGYFRDRFPGEDELAIAVNRPGFKRYKCYTGDIGA